MTLHSRFFRFVSAVCCGTLIALPLQNGYVASAAPDPATTLANSLRALQDGENTAPRDHWDPKYVEAQLGNDPARTFAWVRDRTYWIPYHGILRGPVGVLMDRQGDSLDRALLLATMLKDEGQTVRLAHRTIAADESTSLAGAQLSARLRHLGVIRASARVSGDPLPVLSTRYGLDSAALEKTLQTQMRVTEQRSKSLASRLDDQANRLRIAIGKPADSGANTNVAAALAAFQDHWWVQTQQGTTWRNWDLANAAPAAPDRTVDPANLPVDLYHQITVRVVGEKWQGGTTSENVILEHAWHPASTIGQSISVAFAGSAWPKPFPYAGQTVEQSLRTFATSQHEWTPVLSIGRDRVQQSAVTDSGNLTMSTSGNDALAVARNATRGLGAAINDVFGSAPAAPAPASASHLSAVWIEYQIDSPGAPMRRIRREVFDLLGPAARASKSPAALKNDDAATLARGLAMLTNTDILPVVSELPPQYVNHLAAQSLIANQSLLNDAMANRLGDDFAAAQAAAARVTPGPTDLYRLALSRFALSRMNGMVFVDRPDILTRHQAFRVVGPRLVPIEATDIVSASVGVDPFVPSPFAVRLLQGVFDTNAEAVLLSERPTAGALAWAYDGARDWVTLTSPADPKLASLALSPDVHQRISNALASGQIVVAPKTPVAVGGGTFVGWWQIDRQTGETLGMGETGWGQALPEWIVVLISAAGYGFLFGYLGCLVAGGANCVKAGAVSAAINVLTAGLGMGIGALAGAGGAGAGVVGGLAGEEGALGSAAGGLGGEAGAAGEAGAGAGAAGGAGGAAGEGAGTGAGAGGGGAGNGPTPAEAAAAWKKFFSQAQQMDRGAWPEFDAWLDNPNATMADFPKTGGPSLQPAPGGGWEVRVPEGPPGGVETEGPTSVTSDALRSNPQTVVGDPGGGVDPLGQTGGGGVDPLAQTQPAGGGSPTSPLATTIAPNGNATSPFATTIPPGGTGGGATVPMGGSPTIPGNGGAVVTPPPGSTIPMGTSPTVPGCALPCTPGGATTLVGLGGAIGALGGS